jgi:hypothetical protein
MPVRALAFALVFLTFLPAVGFGQDQPQNTTTVVYEDDTTMPSIELLEFLGEWETEDGDWIDPMLLDEMLSPEREYSDE